MQRFESASHAQRFLSNHSRIHNYFQLHRHLIFASECRAAREVAFCIWQDAIKVAPAA